MNILDPQPEEDLKANPLMAAGLRGLDKLRWELGAGQMPGAM